ncbi:ATP:cob(I)alamin adenosyltransferase, partial [Candidatus Sumerlaeota bacterium]|nr:ATP:cob(I)alamin adenosyltransferase [Candidatus Sumerlaeota bacterium]
MGKADSKSQPPLRITKVYTRTGDAGTTRLVGGQVLKKNHPRIEAYGTVDELSVAMGQARNAVSQFIAATELTGNPNEMLDELQGTKVRRRAK